MDNKTLPSALGSVSYSGYTPLEIVPEKTTVRSQPYQLYKHFNNKCNIQRFRDTAVLSLADLFPK